VYVHIYTGWDLTKYVDLWYNSSMRDKIEDGRRAPGGVGSGSIQEEALMVESRKTKDPITVYFYGWDEIGADVVEEWPNKKVSFQAMYGSAKAVLKQRDDFRSAEIIEKDKVTVLRKEIKIVEESFDKPKPGVELKNGHGAVVIGVRYFDDHVVVLAETTDNRYVIWELCGPDYDVLADGRDHGLYYDDHHEANEVYGNWEAD
jgi:hypothetical protein